jgi:hypothetical protein
VGTDREEFAEGVMIPSLPVLDETNVPPDTVMFRAPLLTDTLISGVGKALVGLLVVELSVTGMELEGLLVVELIVIGMELMRLLVVELTVAGREVVGLVVVELIVTGIELVRLLVVELTVAGPELAGLLIVEFTVLGGISPDSPVEKVTAVDPKVEKVVPPVETVTLGAPDVELGGGIAPDNPVEVETKVDSTIEMISTPEEVVTVMFKPGVCAETGAVLDTLKLGGGPTLDEVVLVVPIDDDGGGINPSDPNEVAVRVLLATEKLTFPKETVSTMVTTPPLGVGLGGISPLPPLLMNVAVEPDTVTIVEPFDIVTTSAEVGGITDELAVKVTPELVKT